MECKGTFNIKKINFIVVEFMLYILSRGLLSCNQHDICRKKGIELIHSRELS